MGADTLQKVFKTFSDPTRVRILALLEREELAVQELMDVLGMRDSERLRAVAGSGLERDREIVERRERHASARADDLDPIDVAERVERPDARAAHA